MNGHFTTEIGRLRMEEQRNRAARYHELARVKREADLNRRNVKGPENVRMPRYLGFLYRRALKIAGLSMLLLTLLATAAMAAPAGPGTAPGTIKKGVEVATVSDGSGISTVWILATVALVAGVAALLVALSRQRSPKTA
ncbi:MAG: hypothetical protein GEU78_13940 [Actinobacteria bacterium]|nr:hypothetical protein [Actinomycetota bacterium]